jgi:hypothetical protein
MSLSEFKGRINKEFPKVVCVASELENIYTVRNKRQLSDAAVTIPASEYRSDKGF